MSGNERDPLIETSRGDWRALIVRVYGHAFQIAVLVFLTFVVTDIYLSKMGDGVSSAATPYALTEHGRTVFLPAWEGQVLDALKLAGIGGLGGVILMGFLLHLGLGVKIFTNIPTWTDRRR